MMKKMMMMMNSLSEEVASARLKRNKKSKKVKKNKNKKKAKTANKANKKKSRKNKMKGRMNKKGSKNNKNRGKRKNGNRKTARTVNGKCLEIASTAMNRWRGVVANFNKQKTRIEKQAEIAGKKGGKKSVFGPIALKLVDLGGGNKSALSCSGSTTSSGAKQLTNLTNTLFACEVSITIVDV